LTSGRHDDLAVEAAWTHQRRVEHVGTVGRSNQDDAFIGLEAVHLDEQLVERLFALVIAAAKACATMAADGVDFIDEDDARRVLLGLLEHVAHTGCADAHEHFDEIRTGNGEEGNIGFAGDGARRQRLAGAGRTHEQNAARDLAAEPLELLRIAQELDDFLEILLGFINAGHVGKGHPAMCLGQKLRLRLAKSHGAAGAALHLAHEEDPDTEDEQDRQPGDQVSDQSVRTVDLRPCGDRHVAFVQSVDETGITGRVGLKPGRGIGVIARDPLADDRHVTDTPRINILEELRIGDVTPRSALARTLEHVEQCDQQERDDCPKGKIAEVGIHALPRDQGLQPPALDRIKNSQSTT
jgi:hypothetical protein